jgi:hypothetical protein
VGSRAVAWSAALALVTCLPVTPARCGVLFTNMTVAGPFDTRTKPRIALSSAGLFEVLYACGSPGPLTAWCLALGEPVFYEAIASDLPASTYPQPIFALAPWGSPRAAYFKPNGRFICALREPGGWVEDSSLVDVVFSTGCQQWLAADPVSGEPRVAFTVAQGESWRVRYAWRENGLWSVADVDSDFVLYAPLALALDASGRPYVAYASVTGETLFVSSRDTPGAPFQREVATADTSTTHYSASVAVDPASGQPRVAYFSWGEQIDVGYAFRDEVSGTWTSQLVDSLLSYPPHPVTLALDAAGNPTLAYTDDVPILASSSRAPALGPDSPLEGGTTGQVWLARRTGGAGSGPFSLEPVPLHDVVVEAGGMAVTPDGYAHLALRSPELSVGSPLRHHSVVYAYYYQDPADVPPPTAAEFSLAPPVPNPARAGDPLRVAFTLPRVEAVRCDLLDASGRHVATLPSRRCAAGPNTLSWTPGPLPPGLYFLRLRSGAGLIAVRRLALLR